MKANKRKEKNVCPKCFKISLLTDHHVLPKRFFGKNDSKLRICRICHIEFEKLIKALELHKYGRFTEEEYYAINESWLKGGKK